MAADNFCGPTCVLLVGSTFDQGTTTGGPGPELPRRNAVARLERSTEMRGIIETTTVGDFTDSH